MDTARLAAFTDGVVAIIITIMVLELKVPHGLDWEALRPLLPVFLSYVLSFIYVGIYWNNHHHLLKACGSVNGGILWANLHLLFCRMKRKFDGVPATARVSSKTLCVHFDAVRLLSVC